VHLRTWVCVIELPGIWNLLHILHICFASPESPQRITVRVEARNLAATPAEHGRKLRDLTDNGLEVFLCNRTISVTELVHKRAQNTSLLGDGNRRRLVVVDVWPLLPQAVVVGLV
jgi:hypothetical protein